MLREDGVNYRLAPRERIGWLFGLSMVELVVGTVTIVATAGLMLVGQYIVAAIVLALGAVLIVPAFGGSSLLGRLPTIGRFVRMRAGRERQWFAPVPILPATTGAGSPRALRGQEVLGVAADRFGQSRSAADVAVSHDRANRAIAATVRVQSQQFLLQDREEKDWMLAGWGRALQGFVSERRQVRSVKWSEHAAPAGLDGHREWIKAHLAEHPLAHVRDAYAALLKEGDGHTNRHETLVTITVDITKVKIGKRHNGDQVAAAVETLAAEVRAFTQRAQAASLLVSTPLSVTEWSRAMRLRLDPSNNHGGRPGTKRPPPEDRPEPDATVVTATSAGWEHWRTDSGHHRAFHIREWPRLDVSAGWLGDLLLYAGAVRTLTVVFEPVPPSRSRRSIRTQMSKISGDANMRGEHGYRVTGDHRRAHEAVEERERELIAGYSETRFAGIVTITAGNDDELEQASSEITQVAAGIGIELRPLNGRHDQGVVASLPVARSITGSGR